MPDSIALEVAPGTSVVWNDLDEVRSALAAGAPNAAWRLEGGLAGEHSAIRVLTGASGKGSVILIAGARPKDADGHDAENPRAVLVSRSGNATLFDEALVSTQYSADGQVERVGLELYAPGDDYPVRGAGNVTSAGSGDEGALRREWARLDFRLDGEEGSAIFEILRA